MVKKIVFFLFLNGLIASNVYSLSTSSLQNRGVAFKPLMNFLYNNKIGSWIRFMLKQPFFSKAMGSYFDLPISKYHIPRFIKHYSIDMSESEKSFDQFVSFNDFFTRRLVAGARPIDNNQTHIISPADSAVIVLEQVSLENNFPIKEQSFNLMSFLKNKKLAQEYVGGTLLIFRLAPYDYHRFHFPLSCIPSSAYLIKGILDSVHPIAYSTSQPLHTNERQMIKLTSDLTSPIIMVPVGAMCVGKIRMTYTPDKEYQKGDEAGYFCFGGSTVALLFKANTITVNPQIVHNSALGQETSIKMGEYIAHLKP